MNISGFRDFTALFNFANSDFYQREEDSGKKEHVNEPAQGKIW